MNIQSILLLAIVVAAFLIVGYRYVKRQKNSRGCGGCNCGCGGENDCEGCGLNVK
ncbi:MAG: FeoB-associated Cys-rich membrane protein [Bacteroidaceae bacterium]|nr:FeoB-associated Cys-rich membrane protein [Bacteroidaceae bacterium]